MGQDKERPVVADFVVEHAEKGGTVIYSREKYGDGRPRDTIAAFTTPGEMLTWLAGEYGVDNKAGAKSSLGDRIVPSKLANKFEPREVTIEPGFYWPTREALLATLEEALDKARLHNGPFLPNAMLAAALVDEIAGKGTGK